MQSNTVHPVMKSVIREDLVALTGDYRAAVVLNQLIYWTKRIHDFDKFLQEEYNRNPECNVSFRYGWIIKTAQELADETMLGLSRQTIRSILKNLIERGVIEESYLDDNKWDKTTKYRLNLVKLQKSLFIIGYPLNDFTISENLQNYRMLSLQHSRVQFGHSKVNSRPSYVNNLTNNIDKKLHTEIISENSSSITSSLIDDEKKIAIDMKNVWIEEIEEEETIELTEILISKILISYHTIFNSSLNNWRSYCRKIASSQFLMGEKKGTNFKAKLSWAIKSKIYERIQAGDFTLGDRNIRVRTVIFSLKEQDKLNKQINDSGKYPLWIAVCQEMLARGEGQAVKQWLLELDIAHYSSNNIYIHAPNRFARDWVNKNLKSQLISALEEVLGHPVDHLKIEVPQNFGILPLPELVEGETPNSSPSTYQNNSNFDAPQASNAEEHSVPQSSPLTYPSSLDTAGSLSRELHLKYNELKLNGVNA